MKFSRSFILDGFFILLLVALTIAFYQVLRPFLLDIFLAVILTDLTWRLYDKLSRTLKRPFASFLSVFIFFIIIAGFLTMLGFLFAQEAGDGFGDEDGINGASSSEISLRSVLAESGAPRDLIASELGDSNGVVGRISSL